MSEFSFEFSSQHQRELYGHYRRQFQNLDWRAIHEIIQEEGEYQLGLVCDLEPGGGKPRSALTELENEEQIAWASGLLQVIAQEQGLCLTFRPDRETGQRSVWVTARHPRQRRAYREKSRKQQETLRGIGG